MHLKSTRSTPSASLSTVSYPTRSLLLDGPTHKVGAGTAVYVYFILPNNKLQPVGITRKTLCNFVMDDELIGTFEHDSDGSEVYQYNTLVYANTTIPDGEHTMVLQMPVLVLPADELAMTRLNVIFDRAVYTYVSNQTISRLLHLTAPISCHRSTTQDNSTESTKKKKPVGGIIAGVVGSLVVVAHLIGLAFWLRKRRRRQRHTIAEKAPPAHQNENDSFLPRAFDIDRSSTIPSMGRFKSDPLATSPVRASHASASEDFDPYADSDSASRTVGDTGRSPVGSGEWRLDMNGFQYVTVAGGSRTATATARRPSSELLFDNSTVTSSSGSVSPPPSKRRAGTAQGRPVSKSTQSSSTTGSSTPLFQHRDSGLRVSEAAVVEEIPPEYSAG